VTAALVAIVVLFLVFLVVAYARPWRRVASAARGVRGAAAEAAQAEPWFAADAVEDAARELFLAVRDATFAPDPAAALRPLVTEELWTAMAERRWLEHNGRLELLHPPGVELVGLVNREGHEADRVAVRITVDGGDEETVRAWRATPQAYRGAPPGFEEYWTLAPRGDGWVLAAIEGSEEGAHHLSAPLVPTPSSPTEPPSLGPRLQMDAAVELAPGVRERAAELAGQDPRFDLGALEAAVRAAPGWWLDALDAGDPAFRVTLPARTMRTVGAGGLRIVVRDAHVERLRVASLDADSAHVQAWMGGRRWVEHEDTLGLVSGSREEPGTFVEEWRLEPDGGGQWRLGPPVWAV